MKFKNEKSVFLKGERGRHLCTELQEMIDEVWKVVINMSGAAA